MTGHNSSRGQRDNEPAAVGDATAEVGPGAGPAEGAFLGLDQALAASVDRLLVVLQSRIDVDAGLAAVRATHESAATENLPAEDPATVNPATGRHDNRWRAHETDLTEGAAEQGELGSVCAVLAGYVADLAPTGDDRIGAPPGLGGSVLSLGAVHRLLGELRNGLLHRSLDRDAAVRLLRLIEHNIEEAGQLLLEERRRARYKAHPQIDAWLATAGEVRWGMTVLRPRVLHLFQDSDQATATAPIPRLPV